VRSGPCLGPDTRARELAPIGTELESHHDAGDDAETKGDAENFEPEIEDDPVRGPRWRASIVVSHAANPIVKDGNMMWKETVKANCNCDSSNADKPIAASSRQSANAAKWRIHSPKPD
jgi:hypothetical protein